MSRLYATLLTVAFTFMTAFAANAATLANVAVEGSYEVEDGRVITLSGGFSGDASGLLALDPSAPLPLVFGALVNVNGSNIFSGEVGPLDVSPLELLFAALNFGDFLDTVTGGAFGAAADYAADGAGRTDLTDTFDFGGVELFFGFTGGQTGPGTLAGTFTAILTQTDTTGPTLSDIINFALSDLDLLGTPLEGFVFPTNDTGTFETEITVAAVPLPAGLPLLGAGLLGLIALQRRRRPA